MHDAGLVQGPHDPNRPQARRLQLDQPRQSRSTFITQTIGFTFQCQTVISDNTWIFIN